MTESYVEFGAVPDLPDELAGLASQFAHEFEQDPRIAKRAALAGPNDIFDFVMPAAQWAVMLPWVEKVLGGAAAYVGGYLTSVVLKSRIERKLDNRMDVLDTRIDQISERAESLGRKMDSIIEYLNEARTPWGNQWELRIGLKGSIDTVDRAAIVSELNSEIQTKINPSREQSGRIKREDVARAILASAVLGPNIEAYMKDFRLEHGDETRFMGSLGVSEDGTLTAQIYTTKTGEHLPFDRWTIRFIQRPEQPLEVVHNKSD